MPMLLEETLALLGRFGVCLDSSLDEQQLVDQGVVELLISAAEIEKRDTVLEVGSGVGNITSSLTGKADRVVAVEKNPKFIPILRERFGNLPNFDLILGDALRVQLPRFDKVVSNLPY